MPEPLTKNGKLVAAAQLQAIANLYNAAYDSKVGYVTEKQWASVLKGAGVTATASVRTSFVTSSSGGGSSASTAKAPASAALGSSMAYYTGQIMSRTYTVTMQFKNSNVVATGGSKYYDKQKHWVFDKGEWKEEPVFSFDGYASVSQENTYRWPLEIKGLVSSDFLEEDAPHPGGHRGVDFAVKEGTNIYPIADGEVVSVKSTIKSREEDPRGKYVFINHGDGIYSAYQHNSENLVAIGDKVTIDDVIGKSGNTGSSTGPHLHVEMLVGVAEALDKIPFPLSENHVNVLKYVKWIER